MLHQVQLIIICCTVLRVVELFIIFEDSMIFFANYGLSKASENAKFDMIFDIMDGYIQVEY